MEEETKEDEHKNCCRCVHPHTTEIGTPTEWPGGEEGGSSLPGQWGPIKQLYCRSGFHLVISKKGKVRGTRKAYHKYAVLEFSSDAPGEVRILGKHSGYYLAMTQKGKLYGELESTEEACVFVESYQEGWNTYLSRKYAHLGWYVGINKVGKAKAGHKTSYNQKPCMFLPTPIAPE